MNNRSSQYIQSSRSIQNRNNESPNTNLYRNNESPNANRNTVELRCSICGETVTLENMLEHSMRFHRSGRRPEKIGCNEE